MKKNYRIESLKRLIVSIDKDINEDNVFIGTFTAINMMQTILEDLRLELRDNYDL